MSKKGSVESQNVILHFGNLGKKIKLNFLKLVVFIQIRIIPFLKQIIGDQIAGID